ncbi:hypothetical protein CVT25_009970 [Psilocybe cyanescens]|uniref:Uncharacterized protein n=1 Tax=Psilocybe cyanescens TaxID=93625 RepID=A0A409XCY4_PSICY|nr:hypothetical protein CVT25_009970 [Psilocybe cyanescens]
MGEPISLAKANFLALVLETLLYGAFTVLFLAALWVITVQRSVVNYRLLVTVVAIWLISTTHLVLDVVRAVNAFVDNPLPGGALEYYGNLSDPLQAAKTAIFVLLTLVGDAFVIYRCYIIWHRQWWVVVLPMLLWCGTGVGGFGATVAFSQAAPGAEVFLPAIVPWITSFISMTLATNILCTLLIGYRIEKIRRDLKGAAVGGSVGQSAVIMVIESAAIYSSAVICLMITYQLDSNAQYTVLDLTSPLIGITFTIIILRVSLGISAKQLSTFPSDAHNVNGNRSRPTDIRFQQMTDPVNIKVSHLVETDNGRDAYASSQKSPMGEV